MIIYAEASQVNFEIAALEHRNPGYIFQMTLAVVAADLRVSAILAQTYTKHSFLYESLAEHNVINWSE